MKYTSKKSATQKIESKIGEDDQEGMVCAENAS
jgi:hypothetical protein